jgi:Uma2 family endonuclease
MNAYTITLDPVGSLTDEAFYQLCRTHPDVKFERSANGELIVMSPTGAGKVVVEILRSRLI